VPLRAAGALREPSLIPGIVPISPLDVLDLTLLHRNENAFMLHTWTL